MWLVIMISLAVLALLALFYLLTRFHQFSLVQALGEEHRLLSWLAALLPIAVLSLFARMNATTLIIVLLHLTAGFLLCGLLSFLLKKLAGLEIPYDIQGAAAIGITLVYLCVGWFLAHHVFETDYRIETAKALTRDYRIVGIADAHLGVTLDGEGFRRELEKVQALEPDAVVLAGDFVDDDSDIEDLTAACKALGELKTAFGVYFAYGNHDKGYYNSRNFTPARLREELEKNGVRILEDECVPLDDGFWLVGRKDRSDPTRADIKTLMAGIGGDQFRFVIDHQPNDYEAEAEAGADLVFSGHTHGGHIFPAGPIGMLMGANDASYGLEKRGNTDFIVTSGISGWAIPFKTGTRSEIVVMDITSH
jgi:Predicted phosphohydrolases